MIWALEIAALPGPGLDQQRAAVMDGCVLGILGGAGAATVASTRKTRERFDPGVELADIDLGREPNNPHRPRFSEGESGVKTLSGRPPNAAHSSTLGLCNTRAVSHGLDRDLPPGHRARAVNKERLISSRLTKIQFHPVLRIEAGPTPTEVARDQNKTLRTLDTVMHRIPDARADIMLNSKKARVDSASVVLEGLPS